MVISHLFPNLSLSTCLSIISRSIIIYVFIYYLFVYWHTLRKLCSVGSHPWPFSLYFDTRSYRNSQVTFKFAVPFLSLLSCWVCTIVITLSLALFAYSWLEHSPQNVLYCALVQFPQSFSTSESFPTLACNHSCMDKPFKQMLFLCMVFTP